MKKYIFSDKTEENFIAFEGQDKCFWESNDSVRYCHMNLNYTKAILFHKKGILAYKEVESSENEYNDYIKKANLSEKEIINEWLKYFNLA